MLFETRFNYIICDWKRVKNHCRTTDNKGFTDKDATDEFKEKLLISEHSPIRLIEYDWSWVGIPYWVSTEWSRHKFEKFISSQRDDRLIDDIPRDEKPQAAPVNFDGYANQQHVIDGWRKRLCFTATPQARGLAVNFKFTLEEIGHKAEASVLVPNCVYRCGCPEFTPCGFWNTFRIVCERDGVDIFNIRERYAEYTKLLHEMEKKVV